VVKARAVTEVGFCGFRLVDKLMQEEIIIGTTSPFFGG
jgi:hypothetical protein